MPKIYAMGLYKHLYDHVDGHMRLRLEDNIHLMMRFSDNDAYFESVADLRNFMGERGLQIEKFSI